MVKTRIVPKEDMEVLKKYLDEMGAVLIDESILDSLDDEQIEYLKKNDGRYANYDFGGDADIWVDLVTNVDHSFIGFLFPERD